MAAFALVGLIIFVTALKDSFIVLWLHHIERGAFLEFIDSVSYR